jgi:hypothetical protein
MNLAQRGLLISLLSYAFFALAEYFRPGFVSTVFSVHWFLLAVIVCVVWGDRHNDGGRLPRWMAWALQLLFAILLMFVVWREMTFLEDMRFFVTLAAGAVPFLVKRLARQT